LHIETKTIGVPGLAVQKSAAEGHVIAIRPMVDRNDMTAFH